MYWLKKSPPPEKGAVTLSSGLGVVCHCKQQNLCVCVSVCKATTFQLEGEKKPWGVHMCKYLLQHFNVFDSLFRFVLHCERIYCYQWTLSSLRLFD